jgi:hypothetical protein
MIDHHRHESPPVVYPLAPPPVTTMMRRPWLYPPFQLLTMKMMTHTRNLASMVRHDGDVDVGLTNHYYYYHCHPLVEWIILRLIKEDYSQQQSRYIDWIVMMDS